MDTKFCKYMATFRLPLIVALSLMSFDVLAQNESFKTDTISLLSLAGFANPGTNWKIVGDAAGTYQDADIKTSKGSGVLFNDFQAKNQFKEDANLFTSLQHSDVFLSVDFLMPKGSNSGIYFQGRYEIQLYDSWKVAVPLSQDCGSIYERWDESRPEGNKGFEGHPARVNASFAPNLWQHLEVEFRAPRFDASGKKISPARFVKVSLNGMILHENVILTGPTRAAAFVDEKATGPIMIQGDHGPVAFRNLQYALLDDFKVDVSDIQYTYYEGKFSSFKELTPDKITRTGKTSAIDSRLADNPNELGLVFTAKVVFPETNAFQFTVQKVGPVSLVVDGEEIIKPGDYFAVDNATKTLTKGEHILKLSYLKDFSWAPTGLGLSVSRPNSRPFELHAPSSLPVFAPEPLIRVVPQQESELVRSFMWHQGKKKTHVISVGAPSGVNYSYNLDQAAILKVWRGEFLNVTNMWFERGEPQTADPMGAAVVLGGYAPVLMSTSSLTDSIAMKYVGYTVDKQRNPTFKYIIGKATLEDRIQAAPDGGGLSRTLTLQGTVDQSLRIRVAEGKRITQASSNIFIVDQQYYISIPDDKKGKATIESIHGTDVLLLPATTGIPVTYSFIW